ncbi:hypothetical protein KUTeg_000424 [Tegillarca granosa]|uniref:hydroxyacid-oxoacid transhydrogenase n=1 Tax=Tegillarca granosa TaxID=220873 RepID=A0ABQ9FXH6_TEGGR|nr:hypothetical protein KUTeg_000424 [Tegillarca granosa]
MENQRGNYGTVSPQKEYAFEMACSNIKYGEGVTREVGMDCINLGGKNVGVYTDKNLAKLDCVKTALQALNDANVNYKFYDKVRVEPTDESFKEAIDFAKKNQFDLFLAIGGGSVIDTCKAANLYSTNPKAELLDYVNAPIGKGLPVTHQLKPLIAVTTTAGTGSETTGIGNRAIRPTLGIVDPFNIRTMPERVTAYSGIDVHALESYTAVPYNERVPRPENPNLRPAYQGSNPISDIWVEHSLRMTSKYIKRAVYDQGDTEARSSMHLASCYAGVGFGNAGCHLWYVIQLCHNYDPAYPLVPHGLSVIVSAPAVFSFTAPACPERHLKAAELLGTDVSNKKKEDAGQVLADTVRKIMDDIQVPNGLQELGYNSADIPALHRVIKLAPRPQTEEDLASCITGIL